MTSNESYQLSLQCRQLEGQISQERILNQQLQAALSAEQSAHRALQADVQKKEKEFAALKKDHEELQRNYRALNAELEEAVGQMAIPASRTRSSQGGSLLRASTSYYTGPETVDRWVQVEDQDMIQERDVLLNQIDELKGQCENLRRENNALREVGNKLPVSQTRRRASSYAPPNESDEETVSTEYTSGSDNESAVSAAKPSPPAAFRLKLALPALPVQSAAALAAEDTYIAEETPRYGGNLTGRLRMDQPVNLTHAISAASQRQIGRASIHAAPTPRGGSSGLYVQHSVNHLPSPRLQHLAEKFHSASSRAIAPSSSMSVNIPPPPPHAADAEPKAQSLERHNTMAPSQSSRINRHVEPEPTPSPPLLSTPPPPPLAAAAASNRTDTNNAYHHQTTPAPSPPGVERDEPSAEHNEDQTVAIFASLAAAEYAESEAHMFSFGDHVDPSMCTVCSLMDDLKRDFGERMGTRQAYYAAGWLPEVCERWMFEHQLVWTIEERAAIATALHEKYTREVFKKCHLSANVKVWRSPSHFWKSPWKECHVLLHGVFLYVFASDKPKEPLLSASLVRGAAISIQRNQDKDYVIRLECLGCGTCVGAPPGNHVEELLIAFSSEATMKVWKGMLENLGLTCPHMCSSKFANSVNALREIAEDLLTGALREERRQKKLKVSASP